MPTPLRRRMRLARRAAWYAVAGALVCMALVLGVASQVLPLAERHPDKIAAWLSERAGRPVAFDQVQTQWTRRGPLLQLDGLRVGAGSGAIGVGEAEVLVSIYAGLLPGRSFTELRLRNLSLTLERADDGRWSVRGLPGQRSGGDPLQNLEGLGELQVIDAELSVLAPSLGWHVKVPEVDLRLRVDGNRVRAGAHAWARSGGEPLRASLEFDRSSGDGRGYVDAGGVDLSDWSALLRYAGVSLAAGEGQARAWAELRRNRVVMLTSEVQLTDVVLRGTPLAAGADSPLLRFDRVEGSTRWRVDGNGWRLDAPSLLVGDDKSPRKLDGLVLAGGKQWAVLADEVDAQPLLAVLSLSDRLEASTRRWLAQANPRARLSGVSIAGTQTGVGNAQGRLADVGFDPAGERPGISGLAGNFNGDADGFVLNLDPRTPLRVDWPSGFGVVHDVTLDGQLAGWRESEGWQVGTSALRIRGKDYGAQVRGGLWFQGDGSRPWMTLAADIDQAPIMAAKGFWIRHRMPKAALQWLDQALLDGQLHDGQAIVSGDLDNWPFIRNDGRFEASARIQQARLKFNPEWPVLEQVDAEVRFIGNGFTLNGTGSLAGVGVKTLQAEITDFAKPVLAVSATGGGDAAQLLTLTRQSPLKRQHAETLASLRASGPARATFELLQPLRARDAGRRKMSGTVELLGARLADTRWELAFDKVRGSASYGSAGFRADQLAVSRSGQPGVLSLRAGDGTRDPQQAFEAELAARLTATELLERAPEMAWLKPYVHGRSAWSVGVSVPKAGTQGAATQLRLRSDLVGTTLTLPAPLDKSSLQALTTTVHTALPLGAGEIDVAFGNLLALRARSSSQQTGVRVVLGTNVVSEAAPASGLIVSGRTGSLDALEWIALARSSSRSSDSDGTGAGTGGQSNRLPLRRIDISTQSLQVFGARFPDSRLQVAPEAGALAVTLEGPALAGRLRVPEADAAAITGAFARVHWPAPPAKEIPVVAKAVPDAGDDAFDPSSIPPLALEIEDLHFGQARLGNASLRTQRLPAGLRVQKLALRSPGQQIDIEGSWMGGGAAARTQVAADIASEDFGKLLDQLGFKGQVAGGEGKVRFDAGWSGGPASFALATMQGGLQIDARNGQLLEVEPGAGRVLGLLSITQLPRRMLLDFRDFFSKGLAFNRIEGKVDFGAGVARSDDLLIDGPAAEIQIRGSTDLSAQRFDQTIEVLPKSGNLLAVVGAVAGGPIGAAVGAAANAVLGKPLGALGARTYRVTGPWKDPKVKVISKEQSRTRATPAVDAAG